MKLSIIVRTMNRLEYSIRTIVSISEKSGLDPKDYEIICVDQNSTDGTREWLLEAVRDNYYPVKMVFLDENCGDGLGMQAGIERATGEFISQLDNDIELVTDDYYQELISLYETLEADGEPICALGGTHKQGFKKDSAPLRFGKNRFTESNIQQAYRYKSDMISPEIVTLYYSAWVTAAFIFRNKFTSHPFGKGMCNEFCGFWWDSGYVNMLVDEIKFWHIDSSEEGGEYIQKQYDKFPSYQYIFRHYKNFIKRK